MKSRSFRILPYLLFFSLLVASTVEAGIKSFVLESHYAVPEGEVAEIIAASPDGTFLYYSNASGKKVGVIDISDPAAPKTAPSISTGRGEPTSVALSKDGRFLLVALRNGDDIENAVPGTLSVYDIASRNAPEHVGDIEIGIGPDSIAVAENNGRIVAVVAIEDEESDEKGDATLGGKRPGRVDVVVVDPSDIPASKVSSVQFPEDLLKAVEGVNFPADPQPEFVSISPDGKSAAVTLQENNAVAILDIENPEKPAIRRIFCAGTVERTADLKKNGQVSFTEDFKGRREPDAVTYIVGGDSVYLALANEGDTNLKTFGDNVWSGGRSVSIHTLDGEVVWDSGLALDIEAALLGHYPDALSEKRGTEIEGVAFAEMYGDRILVVASERGSFLAVYRVNDAKKPELLKILPTGIGPEGVTTVTGRDDGKQLLVAANEKDGTVVIYSVSDKENPGNQNSPVIFSKTIPWSAISGFATDGAFIYAVPDNAWNPSRIWRLDMSNVSKGLVEVDREIIVTKDGKPAAYDLEGICWTKDGFWLVGEGKTGAENLLVFAGHDGVVRKEYALPEEMLKKYGDPKNYGFEGLAVAPDGAFIYVALQRGFDVSGNDAAILRFATESGKWEAAWYPLEQHSKDAKKFWMGLSDLELADDTTLLVVERDKGMGDTAEIKRIYSVDLGNYAHEGRLRKELVNDIVASTGLLLEKVESLCILNDDMWITIDNDGAGWSPMFNLGKTK